MENKDAFFEKVRKSELDKLRKEYDDFRKDKDWKVEAINDRFRKELGSKWWREIMEGRVEENGRTLHTKNKFLSDMLEVYYSVNNDYPKNPIYNFITYNYAEYQEYHFKKFNDNHEQDYTFKTELLTKGNHKNFLEWLAKAVVYKSYFKDNNLFTPELNQEKEPSDKKEISFKSPSVKREKEDKRTDLSLNETAYLFKLLKLGKVFLGRDFQKDSQIANAGHLLTGYSNGTLRKKLTKPFSEFTEDEKKKVLEKLEKIKLLINKQLEEF